MSNSPSILSQILLPLFNEFEPNDSLLTALDTGINGTGTALLEAAIGDGAFGNTSGDYDYFQLSAFAGQTITLETIAASVGTGLDPVVGLYDSAGTLLAFDDDGGPGLDSFLTFDVTSSGDYFAVVRGFGFGFAADPFTPGTGFGAGSTGAYDLNLSLSALNDDFGDRRTLTGSTVSTIGSNLGFTGELNEPDHAGISGTPNSAWWTWTAPTSGAVTLDTFGSNYDTSLAVYVGSSLNTLIEIESNDDAGGTLQSEVVFDAVAGATYQIAVDGYSSSTGDIALNLDLATANNDDFADRTVLVGHSIQTTGTNAGFTSEVGEDNHAGVSSPINSAWWSWTALEDGLVTLDTFGSNYDTSLAVYVGSTVSNLTEIGSNDDADSTLQSEVVFEAIAGATYQIAVDGYSGSTGDIALNLDFSAAPLFRTIDGTQNNLVNSEWGAAETQLLRLTDPAYADGVSTPRGGDPSTLPSARAISNAVADQSGSLLNSLNVTDWLWQWGQFIDHDLDLTEGADPSEAFNIPVPIGDSHFDPFNTGSAEITLNRSNFDPSTGTGIGNPRQQVNGITAYIDGSNVYGSDETRAAALRTNDGTGRLNYSMANNGEILLPFNTLGLPNANDTGAPEEDLFLAGDVRANEQIGLSATHTLFMREHNRLADDLGTRLANGDTALTALFLDSGLSQGDFIYEAARRVVGAEIQAITYNEFLPLLIGDALTDYGGYDATVDAGVSNEFSTAAFRVGHTMLSSDLQRMNADGTDAGSVALQSAFFNTGFLVNDGADSLLLGLASQAAQEIDTFIIDDVRNFLFGPPGSGGLDLASLNIQRGRDHGLGSYNEVRDQLGLGAVTDFADITSDAAVQASLASVYSSVDEVDLWVGGLAEDHVTGVLVGETFQHILADQFARTRDGDRFWYEDDDLLATLAPDIADVQLSDIILANSSITNIQDNVFVMSPSTTVSLGASVQSYGSDPFPTASSDLIGEVAFSSEPDALVPGVM